MCVNHILMLIADFQAIIVCRRFGLPPRAPSQQAPLARMIRMYSSSRFRSPLLHRLRPLPHQARNSILLWIGFQKIWKICHVNYLHYTLNIEMPYVTRTKLPRQLLKFSNFQLFILPKNIIIFCSRFCFIENPLPAEILLTESRNSEYPPSWLMWFVDFCRQKYTCSMCHNNVMLYLVLYKSAFAVDKSYLVLIYRYGGNHLYISDQ